MSWLQGVLIVLLWVVAPLGLALYLQATKAVLSPRQRAAGAAAAKKRNSSSGEEEEDCAKRGWSARKVPANLDAIVIGSGIGGLATAALLARRGQRVLVLEQHDVAGGACHTFEERPPKGGSDKLGSDKGEAATAADQAQQFTYEFDTGVHYVGAEVGAPDCLTSPSAMRRLFDAVSDGSLEWDAMSPHFDHAIVGAAGASKREVFKVHADAAFTEEDLCARFPKQRAAIGRYFALLREADGATVRALALRLLPVGRWLATAAAAAPWGGAPLAKALVALARALAWRACGAPLAWLAARRFRQLGALSLRAALRDECGVTDPKLAGMLGYAWGDAGLAPAELSFATHAMIANHYKGGAYYPRGGPAEIARGIVPVIERAGGAVLVRARVEAILTENAAGAGVAAADSGGGSGGMRSGSGGSRYVARAVGVRVRGVDVFAPVVVSAVGGLQTFNELLRAGSAAAAPPLPPPPPPSAALQPSCSMLSLFVGLRGSTSELQLPSANLWCFPSWDHDRNWHEYEAAHSGSSGAGEADASLAPAPAGKWPALFISFSSAKDSSWAARRGACSTAMVLAPTHFAPFARYEAGTRVKHRGAAYDAHKAVLVGALLGELYAQLPHLRGKVELAELGTPLSNNWYLGSLAGEVYGCAANTRRWGEDADKWVRCETDVEGLFRAGQDSLSPGVAGAAQSAVFCVAAMSPGGLWHNLNLLV
jgi:all-trans-retinol 13,14-reductase